MEEIYNSMSGPQKRFLLVLLWALGIIIAIFAPYFIGDKVQDIWHEQHKIVPLSWMVGLLTCMILTLIVAGLYNLVYWIKHGETP